MAAAAVTTAETEASVEDDASSGIVNQHQSHPPLPPPHSRLLCSIDHRHHLIARRCGDGDGWRRHNITSCTLATPLKGERRIRSEREREDCNNKEQMENDRMDERYTDGIEEEEHIEWRHGGTADRTE